MTKTFSIEFKVTGMERMMKQFEEFRLLLDQYVITEYGIPTPFLLDDEMAAEWYRNQTVWLIQTEQITLKELNNDRKL